MRNEWEGDFQPNVALPLIVQSVNDLKSKVGVRLIDLYLKTFQIRNTKLGTRNVYLHPLVALPHLRFTLFAINTKWEGDFQD